MFYKAYRFISMPHVKKSFMDASLRIIGMKKYQRRTNEEQYNRVWKNYVFVLNGEYVMDE